MDIDLADFESAMSGDADLPLLFDLMGAGFRPALTPVPLVEDTADLDSFGHETAEPARDAPHYSTSTSDAEEEEIEETGELSPKEASEDTVAEESGSDAEYAALAIPAAAGSNLNTPRGEIDSPDYDHEDDSALKWQFCDAWVGAVNFATDGETRIRIPGANAQVVFDDIRVALEDQLIPAADQLCRILLARILYVWEISVRIAFLRASGRTFPCVLEQTDIESEPTTAWVWSIFGRFDECDRVDTFVTCDVKGQSRTLTIGTPVWIWWYLDLLFHMRGDHIVPRRWTELDHIAEHKGAVLIDDDDFKYVILANGAATLQKRQLQTLRGGSFFAGQHPVCQVRGLEDIKCITRQKLGGALSSRAGDNRRVVLSREARRRPVSRMTQRIGMFQH